MELIDCLFVLGELFFIIFRHSLQYLLRILIILIAQIIIKIIAISSIPKGNLSLLKRILFYSFWWRDNFFNNSLDNLNLTFISIIVISNHLLNHEGLFFLIIQEEINSFLQISEIVLHDDEAVKGLILNWKIIFLFNLLIQLLWWNLGISSRH